MTNPIQKLDRIVIKNAREHNLKGFDVEIPHNKLTVVTGVSGSGKSSLIYDILCREGQRRYLESYSSYARQFLGKMHRPRVERVDGLRPTLAVDQKNIVRNPRSTVGTLTEILDLFRLLFARVGEQPEKGTLKLSRSLFSFNSQLGACPHCKGLGVEDRIDPNLIVKDPSLSLREGALVITQPNGYTVYSQVTIDVMNQVCNAHGFDVDTPWEQLTNEEKKVVFHGSNRLKIPFGKHSLESRMKWSGITAKPREEGYYKGILPVMEEILKRDRNANILRFVRSVPCSRCMGTRLNPEALSVTFEGMNIAQWSEFSIKELDKRMASLIQSNKHPVVREVAGQIKAKTDILIKLGVGYLSLNRESTTLSGGEQQRISIANQVNDGLRNVLYIFDEPSIGLHARENKDLIEVLKSLVNQGNTVVVVEHDEDYIHAADWIIDIGPKAGRDGGELLFCGSKGEFLASSLSTPTLDYLRGKTLLPLPSARRIGNVKNLEIKGADLHNLKQIDVNFKLNALNVVTGVSGAGKSTLVMDLLAQELKSIGTRYEIYGKEYIHQVISIDQSPIGKTPRSNPATYTKLSDEIRNLFAELPEPKEKKWTKGMFSFNVKGGRCEACEGAGVLQVGMHFMGNVDVPCPECEGMRFKPEVLEVRYNGKNIYEVLEMTVSEALEFFKDHLKILPILEMLKSLGLDYLGLGQPSSTLSGGEAQRIKLASQLARPVKKHCLYILDEPTTGLHFADVANLVRAINQLVDLGHTVVVIEHHPDLLKQADWIVDLGPESGDEGGYLTGIGTPEEVSKNPSSPTGEYLHKLLNEAILLKLTSIEKISPTKPDISYSHTNQPIVFQNITTHNLKGIDVTIPAGKMTVITGVSGSGKSSLAFDTLYAEGERIFNRGMSAYVRSQMKNVQKGEFESCEGVMPSIAISQERFGTNPRSTVGTLSEIYEIYRLLFARIGKAYCPSCNCQLDNMRCPQCGFENGESHSASHFSFNHQQGSCEYCKGLGTLWSTDPDLLVTHPEKSLLDGAMDGSKTGKFYGEPQGQYAATLKTVGKELGIDFTIPYRDLEEQHRNIAMFGCGAREFAIEWNFKRGTREGVHFFTSQWIGFVGLVNEEYERKHADKRGEVIRKLMKEETCSHCSGQRLKASSLIVRFQGFNIWKLSELSIRQSLEFWENLNPAEFPELERKVIDQLKPGLVQRLTQLIRLELGYLSLNRSTNTLSGGEAQRLRIATQLGSGMQGICYVLDEPSRGLHAKDIANLREELQKLKAQGNTLVVVEHNRELIRHADKIIDLGPDGGVNGGEILAEGSLEELIGNPKSVTGPYLQKLKSKAAETWNFPTDAITIKGASARNLKSVNLQIPVGAITGLVGVSGSGKSTLLKEVIAASAVGKGLINCTQIEGLENFDETLLMEQKGMGKSSTSTPASYTGIMDEIRKIFAQTEKAKRMGFRPSWFSFNSKQGACPQCMGIGAQSFRMDFMSDIWVECEECSGSRFQADILKCRYKRKNIAEVLEMTIREAMGFFIEERTVQKALKILDEVGLGYLQLGQPAKTLSGGESQRLRLATHLIESKGQRKLFLLDEPTSGLHFQDIEKLIVLFRQMVKNGHTLLFVDHHPDLIANSDWLIELGPQGGDLGGKIVAKGQVKDFFGKFETPTAKFLQNLRE